jgi:argininosuccinate lyase
LRISDAFSTGSSLMPQKRNPDGAELARASGGVMLGTLVGFLATLKGLPTGYNKDLQDDKVALLAAERRLVDTLAVLAGTVGTLEPGDGIGKIDPGALATDAADWLVEHEGMTFKEAHDAVGQSVREGSLSPDGWEGDGSDTSPTERALERRTAAGGTARASIVRQISAARLLSNKARRIVKP